MNKKATESFADPREVLDLQKKFIDQFIQEDSAWGQLLISPVGTGKTYLSISLANELIGINRAQRILFLVPSGLLSHYEFTLEKRLSIPTIILDRKKYRLLVDSVPVGTEPWPKTATIVSSIDFAKSSDISDSLSTVDWDIVVVDEAHLLKGMRLELLNKLIGSSCVRRLLLLSATPIDLEIDDLNTIVWRPSDSLKLYPIERNIIEYERTVEETRLLKDLDKFLGDLSSDNRLAKMIANVCEKRVASSINAVESFLYTLRKPKIQSMEYTFEDESEEPPIGNSIEWSDEVVGKWESLLDGVDQISIDSKLERLQFFVSNLVLENTVDILSLCLFTQFRDTASYIEVGLRELGGWPVWALDGSSSSQQRAASVSAFLKKGGVFILTDAAAQGLDFSNVTHLVHYDLPEKISVLEQRIGRVSRIGRTVSLKTYAFHDVLDSWALESDLLQKHGFI